MNTYALTWSMKTKGLHLAFLLIGIGFFWNVNAQVKVDSLVFAPFGKVHLYIPQGMPSSVTIMISGDGGWKYGVIDFSKHFANQNSLVIGVDIVQYNKNLRSRSEECYHISGDFVALATNIEKKYKFKSYQEPLLMGYSSGATMVFAVLAQARPNTFRGGISLGFCPDVDLPKLFCELNGLKAHRLPNDKLFYLDPDSKLGNRWIVLQGKLDNICNFNDTKSFLDKTSDDELIILNKVGHGFSNWSDFMPQWDKAFRELTSEKEVQKSSSINSETNNSIIDLPLVLTQSENEKEGSALVFMISGDGGWYSFEQNLSDRFLKTCIPTIGLDAKKYFWERKTPQQAADDISNVLHHYMELWKKQKVILVGYSIGAEVLPFIFEKLPTDLQKSSRMVLLSPDEKTDFEVHYLNMLGLKTKDDYYDVINELRTVSHMTSIKVIFGSEEKSKMPVALSDYKITFLEMPGDHHYNNDYNVMFEAINNSVN